MKEKTNRIVIEFAKTHSYDAYQLFAQIKMKDESSESCFKYIYLIIKNWLNLKLNSGEIICEKESFKDFDLSKIE